MTLQRKHEILREAIAIRDMARFARVCAKDAIQHGDNDEVAFLTRTVTHLADEAQTLVDQVRERE